MRATGECKIPDGGVNPTQSDWMETLPVTTTCSQHSPLPSRAGFSLTLKPHTHHADKLGTDTPLQDTLVVSKLDLNCMCQLDWVKGCPESWLKVISYYV